jgi:putative ABC transport system permease protein
MTPVVRTGSAAAAVPGIRDAVRQVDGEEPIVIRTAEAEMYSDLRGSRTVTGLFGLFAALALFLAAIGLFSQASQSASERSWEMGVRMAFGAKGSDIVRLLLAEGLSLSALGAAIGLVAAIAIGRVLAALALSAAAADPGILTLSCLLLAAVTAAASYLPARRACRIDPSVVLRGE